MNPSSRWPVGMLIAGIAVLLATSAVIHLHGQSAPTVRGASASAAVELSNEVYTYRYSIRNSLDSNQAVWTVSLDVSQPPGGASLTKDGLIDGLGFLRSTSEKVTGQQTTVRTVPVTCEAPTGWLCSVNVAGRLIWGGEEQSSLVQPGSGQSGYTLMSRGIPTIRTVVFEPFVDPADAGIQPPVDETDLRRHDAELDAFEASLRFQATTIGPTAPPAKLDPALFTGTILHYLDQAAVLGWIRPDGIRISLEAKLRAAQAALTRSETREAANILSALVREVDAQTGKALSSEAGALLKLNTQFVISKLQ